MSTTNHAFPVVEGPLLQKEQSILVGLLLSFATYGITLTVSAFCLHTLTKRRQWSTQILLYSLYICTMLALITIYVILNAIGKVGAYTRNRNYPGGPTGWIYAKTYTPLGFVGTLSGISTCWLLDIFLIYRVSILYSHRRIVVLLPGLLYLASIGSGSWFLSRQIQPNSSSWTNVASGTPFFIISGLCNLSSVFLIVARLLHYRHLILQTVGTDTNHDVPYLSASMIVIESAGLYACFWVTFAVSYALKSDFARIVVPMQSNIRGLAVYLIILRTVKQKGFQITNHSSYAFSPTTLASSNANINHEQTVA